jgi:hypothetical protein
MSAITSLATGMRITDVMAGFKGFRRRSLLALDLQERHFEYEAETVVKAVKSGMKLVQVPITYKKRVGGRSGIRALQDGFNVSKAVLKVYFSIPGQPLGKDILGKNLLKFVIPFWLLCIPIITLTSYILHKYQLSEGLITTIFSVVLFLTIRGISGSWFAGIIASGLVASTNYKILMNGQISYLVQLGIYRTDLITLQILIIIFIGLFLEERRLIFIFLTLMTVVVLNYLSLNTIIAFEVIISLLLYLLLKHKENRVVLSMLVFILLKILFLTYRNVILVKVLDASWFGTLLSILLLETVSFKKRKVSLSHWRRIVLFVSLIVLFLVIFLNNLLYL